VQRTPRPGARLRNGKDWAVRSWRRGGRLTYPAQLGQVQMPPRGPIAITIQILGTDARGNVVTARLDADYPLAPLPPLPCREDASARTPDLKY